MVLEGHQAAGRFAGSKDILVPGKARTRKKKAGSMGGGLDPRPADTANDNRILEPDRVENKGVGEGQQQEEKDHQEERR